jgi:hypothetical protein
MPMTPSVTFSDGATPLLASDALEETTWGVATAAAAVRNARRVVVLGFLGMVKYPAW